LDTALKTLWGANQLPFGAAVEKPYASDTFKETRHRLEQLVAVRACGLLHGPNGVGKTLLVQHFLQSLPDKRYKTFLGHRHRSDTLALCGTGPDGSHAPQ
jgi:predicted ATPase